MSTAALSAQVPHRMSWWEGAKLCSHSTVLGEAASETSSAQFHDGRKREGGIKRQTVSSLLAFLHLQVEDRRAEVRFAGKKKDLFSFAHLLQSLCMEILCSCGWETLQKMLFWQTASNER